MRRVKKRKRAWRVHSSFLPSSEEEGSEKDESARHTPGRGCVTPLSYVWRGRRTEGGHLSCLIQAEVPSSTLPVKPPTRESGGQVNHRFLESERESELLSFRERERVSYYLSERVSVTQRERVSCYLSERVSVTQRERVSYYLSERVSVTQRERVSDYLSERVSVTQRERE